MKKAIFLDRDGTLIEEGGYVYSIDKVKFYPDVFDALKILSKEYIFFIITNQSGIGEGVYTLKEFEITNNYIIEQLKQKDIRIESTYFCPHKKDDKCDCRKPSIKYIKKIISEFREISLEDSWVIGDHPSDVLMGINAGCKTAYLLTGHGEKHLNELQASGIKPTIIAKNFMQAAKEILKYKE
ncbi:MAG: HAD family hydrolase [Candidatus Altiarchaeota archaeon]